MEKKWKDDFPADYHIWKPGMGTRDPTYTWHKPICKYKTRNTRNKTVDYNEKN